MIARRTGPSKFWRTWRKRQAKGEETARLKMGAIHWTCGTCGFFFQTQNQGKGAAFAEGFAQTTGISFWCRTRTWNTTRATIQAAGADSGWTGGRGVWVEVSGRAAAGALFLALRREQILTLLSDIFTNLKLTDMETCYKVFRKEVLQGIKLRQTGSGLSRRSPRRWPNTIGGFMRCRSPTPGGRMKRGRRLPGKMD